VFGRNFSINGSVRKSTKCKYSGLSGTQNKSKSIVQSLLTPKHVHKSFKTRFYNNSSSSSQSLKTLMNNTTSSGNTLFSQISQEINNNHKLSSQVQRLNTSAVSHSSPTAATRSKSNYYNETFGWSINNVLSENKWEVQRKKSTKFNYSKPPSVNANTLLKNSMSQRREFVQEIEGRLKGLKDEKSTPTFKDLPNAEIQSFNFDNELERLK